MNSSSYAICDDIHDIEKYQMILMTTYGSRLIRFFSQFRKSKNEHHTRRHNGITTNSYEKKNTFKSDLKHLNEYNSSEKHDRLSDQNKKM